jgi:uncharacterized protein YqeY
MSLVAKIDADIKQSMLNKEAEKLSVLRMLKSAVKNVAIEKYGTTGTPTDAEVIVVVRKELKKRQDSIESFTSAGRQDLADKEKAEAKFLETFLPASMSQEEAEKLVLESIKEAGATTKAQMGAVMKIAQVKADGRIDNKTLSSLVQKHLA